MDLDLKPFNDIHPQPARNARAVAKLQLKPKAQPRKEKHTGSNLTNAAKDIPVKTTIVHQDSSHSSSLRTMPELQDQEPLDSTVIIHSELPHPDGGISAPVDITSPHLMDQEYADSQDSAHLGCTIFDNHGNIQSGRETADVFFGLDNFIDGSATTNGGAQRLPSETEYRDDDLNSASVDHDFSDLSTITASHPAVLEHLSGFPAGEYVLRADEGNEPSKSSMQLRKRLTAPVLAEPSDDSFFDEDVDIAGDDDYHEDTSCHKRAAKKAKTPVQRRIVSPEKPPKKKFSHSTRRTRRQLNKVLLEAQEDEIDYSKLSIKDIIRLGEIREERTKKDAATAKSANNSFPEDAPYNDDDPFGLNADVDEAPLPKHNYHSLMKKIPKKKWSKQDTKLFYEAIRQFGMDFGMIEHVFPDNHHLFPNKHHKRRQLLLKFKNEERRHPMELHHALTKRTKSRSHFEMVIEKLKRAAAAQAEENCERDDDDDDVEMENDPEANVYDENTHGNGIEEDENAYNWSPSKKDNFDFGENTHEFEHYDEEDYGGY